MAGNKPSSSSSSSFPNSRFPAEFRFHPDDWELIKDYLLQYMQGSVLPFHIPFTNTLCHPESLQRQFAYAIGNEFYCFNQGKRVTEGGSRTKRSVAGGHWKTTSNDQKIKYGNETIGYKKNFTFYEGKGNKGKNTGWIVHEYRLNSSSKLVIDSLSLNGNAKKADDIVLCRIYRRQSSGRNSSQKEADQSASSTPSVTIDKTMTRDKAPMSILQQESYASPTYIANIDDFGKDETFDDVLFPLPQLEMGGGFNDYLQQPGSLGGVNSDECMDDEMDWIQNILMVPVDRISERFA